VSLQFCFPSAFMQARVWFCGRQNAVAAHLSASDKTHSQRHASMESIYTRRRNFQSRGRDGECASGKVIRSATALVSLILQGSSNNSGEISPPSAFIAAKDEHSRGLWVVTASALVKCGFYCCRLAAAKLQPPQREQARWLHTSASQK
jgi:sulfur transfer complex TusBCD TusB component (DsrH family)